MNIRPSQAGLVVSAPAASLTRRHVPVQVTLIVPAAAGLRIRFATVVPAPARLRISLTAIVSATPRVRLWVRLGVSLPAIVATAAGVRLGRAAVVAASSGLRQGLAAIITAAPGLGLPLADVAARDALARVGVGAAPEAAVGAAVWSSRRALSRPAAPGGGRSGPR